MVDSKGGIFYRVVVAASGITVFWNVKELSCPKKVRDFLKMYCVDIVLLQETKTLPQLTFSFDLLVVFSCLAGVTLISLGLRKNNSLDDEKIVSNILVN